MIRGPLLGLLLLAACSEYDLNAPDPSADTPGDTAVPDTGVADAGSADTGVVDTAPAEVCNGVDDNGDGQVDEGFDLDGDGVARCCDPGAYVLYYPQVVLPPYTEVAGRRSNGDGTFQPAATMDAIDSGGEDMRVLGYGQIDTTGGDTNLDVWWVRLSDRATYLTTCKGGEWQTHRADTLDRGPASIGDVNGDGCLDYVAYDYQAGTFGSHGDSGDGFTYLGHCDGTFSEVSGSTFDVRFLSGEWTGGPARNLADWNGDGKADLFVWAVASGGTSPSDLWYLPGDGTGHFGAAVSLPALNQAGNSGEVGDIDDDHCIDWVSGANDDGQSGSVWTVLGDCVGGVKDTRMLVDQAAYATARGQSTYGDGVSRLWDFDGDGDLDLVSSFDRVQGSDAAILSWDNDGAGGFTDGSSTDPTEVIVPLWDLKSISVFTPLPQ